MRKAISLLTAIIFMLLIAVLMGLAISLLGTTTAKVANRYLYEQAQLLARSGTEYAILAIQGHEINSSTGCLNQINLNYNDTFDINITLHYIGKGLPTANCNILDNSVAFDESNASVLVDTIVQLKDPKLNNGVPIRYVKRTLQKL
ncbi:hypothetical protein [Nitratiruptor sp. SB155-2]|uniref:hypothetical protein n=1 Tax=Nitratiruptor sp. (strain SB155-2) TaxID=387092 RepID=UPI0001587365|nr:hypothetical protein [Nitratiruptor sp. SB155-2]BAF70462.1 conserved hypothetical protein [Nitratiruptor sp. SB155-2]